MESELAEMAPAQLAGRHMVRTTVSETTSNSRFRRSRTSIRESGGGRALSRVLTLQAVCTSARMKVSTAWCHSRVLGQLDMELGISCMGVVLHPL